MQLDRIDPVTRLVLAGALILFLAYWTIFAVTTDDDLLHSAIDALNNVVPAMALAWIAHLLLERYVWRLPMQWKVLSHLPAAIIFSLAWYVAILVIRELRGDWLTEGFVVRPFVPVAFAWQMFQGVTFYTLAALASLSIVLSRRLAEMTNILEGPVRDSSKTLLLRTIDGAESVAIESITTISGAGDYSELRTSERKYLTTTTLADFEKRLPKDAFLRAHRSHIVRLAAIVRSEPAGNGRTTLHLIDGQDLVTSRAGARLFRETIL